MRQAGSASHGRRCGGRHARRCVSGPCRNRARIAGPTALHAAADRLALGAGSVYLFRPALFDAYPTDGRVPGWYLAAATASVSASAGAGLMAGRLGRAEKRTAPGTSAGYRFMALPRDGVGSQWTNRLLGGRRDHCPRGEESGGEIGCMLPLVRVWVFWRGFGYGSTTFAIEIGQRRMAQYRHHDREERGRKAVSRSPAGRPRSYPNVIVSGWCGDRPEGRPGRFAAPTSR